MSNNKDKIKKLQTFSQDKDFALFQEISFIADALREAKMEVNLKGDKGDEGKLGEKGEKGEKGEQGKQGERGEKGEQGEQGTRGEQGERGEQGVPGKDGKDGSPDTPEQVLTKLQELKDAWLDVKKIKGNENLATLDILNRAIEILDRRTQFLLHKEVGARVATDTFTTTGGAETITLTYTPLLILVVDVNGQVLSVDASDYSLSGKSLTLLNAATPSGLYGKVAYSY